MKVLLAHPGTQYSHSLAAQLERHGALHEFWTGFAVPDLPGLGALVRRLPGARVLSNRVVRGVPARRLRTMPLVELRAIRALRRGGPAQRVIHERNEAFQRRIPAAAVTGADCVVGFDTSSWLLVDRARALGKRFFLDQTICHPLAQERAHALVRRRFPEWGDTLEPREARVLACERHEHEAADRIVVASDYTRKTLLAEGIPADKIAVNPYGVDLERFHPADGEAARPLRFVFVGSVGARKGVPLLLEAWKLAQPRDAELWLLGPVSGAVRHRIPRLPGLRVLGQAPHAQLPALLRQCDVLVLPSFSEGFGLVLLEALASGLPIVATTATAAPDLIEQGRQGFITEPGDLEQLVHHLRQIAADRGRVRQMGREARSRALAFSWDAYGDRWAGLLGPDGRTC